MHGLPCFSAILDMVGKMERKLDKKKNHNNGSKIKDNHQKLCGMLARSAHTRGQIAVAEPRIPKDYSKAWEILMSKKESYRMQNSNCSN
ncbi:MAG: hypothetical protein PHS95_02825 [Candidatus Pacebacteria bacterium]|nr:hypothetical protein [Candidatus Paceibacterota bacterium]